jgi:hypothetical protein
MKLMDAVLWNRMANPGPFGAKGAKSLADIVRAKNQFAGFRNYPNYDSAIRTRIEAILKIANSTKDSRSATFTEFVNTVIEVANYAEFSDPSPGKLVAWRTANSGSPGRGFTLFKTLGGNDFYYQ